MSKRIHAKFDPSELANKWPSAIVARKDIAKFTGGLLSPKTMANLDSLGKGPPSMKWGRQMVYPLKTFIPWFADRMEG